MKETALTTFQEFKKHRLYKYALSLFIISVTTIIQHLIWPYVNPAPFLLFYPAVVLACLYGDGISAIALSCLSSQYFFVVNGFEQAAWPQDFVRMGIFLMSCLYVRYLVHELVAARLRAESVIEILQEREKELSQEKAGRLRFISTLTHDLRTPLAAIKLGAQLMLKKAEQPETILKSSSRIVANSDRINNMIQDLLDAQQIQSGKSLPLLISDCSLRQIVDTALLDLESLHGKRFKVVVSENIRGHWSCEGIARIIENLCTNAIKYGSVDDRIEISADKIREGVLISVNNKGPVIPEEEQEIIFNPYERLTKTGHQHKGWGLGLTLVKGLVESHGGSIKVESNEAQGTTFSIFLPIDSRVVATIRHS